MPLSPVNRRRVRKVAQNIAESQGLDKEATGAYIDSYVRTVENLNDRSDARLDKLEQEIAAMSVDLVPGAPGPVYAFVTEQVSLARSAVSSVTAVMAEFKHPGLRRACAEAIMDVLRFHEEAVEEAPESPETAATLS